MEKLGCKSLQERMIHDEEEVKGLIGSRSSHPPVVVVLFCGEGDSHNGGPREKWERWSEYDR